MKRYNYFSCLIQVIILITIFSPIIASSMEPVAFGEIKSSGGVQIGSSTGKWVQVQDVYPLLKNTRIRTNDGVVFITTRDGSRIDLSKETEASIDAAKGSYSVALENGTVSFNITPSTSLAITTRGAIISVAQQVGGYYSLVAGVGAPSFTNIKGMVFSGPKGTFIKSISGRINVSGPALQARVLNAGESLFASLEGGEKALGYIPATTGSDSGAIQVMITGAFFTGATMSAIESFRGHGIHSRAGF